MLARSTTSATLGLRARSWCLPMLLSRCSTVACSVRLLRLGVRWELLLVSVVVASLATTTTLVLGLGLGTLGSELLLATVSCGSAAACCLLESNLAGAAVVVVVFLATLGAIVIVSAIHC